MSGCVCVYICMYKIKYILSYVFVYIAVSKNVPNTQERRIFKREPFCCKICQSLLQRKGRLQKEIVHILFHSSDGRKGHGQDRLNPGTSSGSPTWAAGVKTREPCVVFLSLAVGRWIGSAAPRTQSNTVWDAGIASGSFTCCLIIPASSKERNVKDV